jgi:hypothetical protein
MRMAGAATSGGASRANSAPNGAGLSEDNDCPKLLSVEDKDTRLSAGDIGGKAPKAGENLTG